MTTPRRIGRSSRSNKIEQQAITQNTFVSVDGFLINADTGEVLEAVDPGLEGRELCEWALSKRMDAEAQMVALRAKRDALVQNLEKQITEQELRVKKLAWKYDSLIESYAKEAIEATGGKTKTVRFDHGSVSFRTSSGTNKITDMEAAVSFAKEFQMAEFVKVSESINVSDLLKNWNGPTAALSNFVESSGPKETMKIETGVK